MAVRAPRSAVLSRPASPRTRAVNVVCLATADKLKAAVASVAVTAGLLAMPAEAAGVKFSNLGSSAVVSSPVHLEFAVDGMAVKPAAEGVAPNTGHFHVLVDTPAPAEGEAIPFDAAHLHYGKGQTAADIELAPGKHTLTLQFANALHESYGPQYASTVSVTVK